MSTLSIHHERDAEDNRLVKAGEHSRLVESYYGHIVRRCRARTPSEGEAIDVAAEVALRLLDELKRGRRYSVPYRVVVNKVIDWKVKEHYARAVEASLPVGVGLRPLGTHRLHGLRDPETLFQLEADGLPVSFPPPRTAVESADRAQEAH